MGAFDGHTPVSALVRIHRGTRSLSSWHADDQALVRVEVRKLLGDAADHIVEMASHG